MPKCSGLSGHNEQTPILRVPLQTGLRFHSCGYEQPPHHRACGVTNSRWLAGDHCTNSAAMTSVSGGKTAAAMASWQTLLLKGPRSRPLTGDENQPLKPKSQRSGAQVALTVSSVEATASVEAASPMATTTSAPTIAATCPPTPHQRATTAPKRTGRSSLPLSPQEREQDRLGTQVPPSRRTTCCATPGAAGDRRPGGRRTTTHCLGSSNLPSPAWLEDASSAELEDALLPRMPEEEAGRRPTRRQAPTRRAPSPARMMNILEAEGGAEAAARLASPHHEAGDHPYR
jgi:hypothetical protein